MIIVSCIKHVKVHQYISLNLQPKIIKLEYTFFWNIYEYKTAWNLSIQQQHHLIYHIDTEFMGITLRKVVLNFDTFLSYIASLPFSPSSGIGASCENFSNA